MIFGFAVTFCYLRSQELGLSRSTHPALSCSKVKTEATEQYVNFEEISHFVRMFPLQTLKK